MRLRRIRLRNFRAYRAEVALECGDLTVLVGRNDCGKSSILDALEIFLNDSKPDKDDASKSGDPKDLTIICEFDDLPEALVIDDANPTKLAAEFLLNPVGLLEIHKTYSGHLQTPKLSSLSAYAVHPTDPLLKDLLQLTNKQLRERAEKLKVNLEGIDAKVNAPIRQRIRDHVGVNGTAPILVPLLEENGRNIWEAISRELPVFALFKSDRASTDQDPEAQDPLKAAVKEAIKAKEAELKAVADFIEQEVKKIADLTLAKLKEMDPSLASELKPQFAPPKWESIFKASITGDEQIPINKRGSGVKRLILLNFFRAKAERAAREAKRSRVIYAIEEPETSQHPHNQRMLLRALTELSASDQVLVTTHTPMLARGVPDHALRYVHVEQNGGRAIFSGGDGTNELFTKSLGVLPDHSVKIFIGLEGPNDIDFLQAISSRIAAADPTVPDLAELELSGQCIFFPLGGSTLALWVSRLKGLNRPEFHLFDRDTVAPAVPKHQQTADAINARPSAIARITERLEIENYLHVEAIAAAYTEVGINLPLPNSFQPFDDVPNLIARMVHEQSGAAVAWANLSEELRKSKESRAKRMLCGRAASHMTRARLDQVDPGGELIGWLVTIKASMDAVN